MLERCGEKGTLLFCWWECKRIQSLGKVSSEPVLLTSAPLTLGWKLLGEGGGCPALMFPALVWDVPGADSEVRIQEQVIYWGGDSRKHWVGAGSEREKGR